MRTFVPQPKRVYVFESYSLLVIDQGEGLFQVDFKNYNYSNGKAIFLAPKQYFQLLAGSFKIKVYEFPTDSVRHVADSRVLFKHLVSVGYISINDPKQLVVGSLQHTGASPVLLNNAVQEWIHQNPFSAQRHEVKLLFDLKDIVDEKYREPISVNMVSQILQEKPEQINKLTKEKLAHTVHKLKQNKLLLEAQRKIIFTDLSSKEIAYELGFKDAAYFNRFFKQHTNKVPYEFRNAYEIEARDSFVVELYSLINEHYKEQHLAKFYADKLCLTPRSLGRKVKQKLGVSTHDLIKDKLLSASKLLLLQGASVTDIAFELGFQEPNHFSAFFKKNVGCTPMLYRMSN